MVSDSLIILIAVCGGLILQWGVLMVVRRPALLAVPNERSSHSQPTPTMGGIAIVLAVLLYLLYLTQWEPTTGFALCGALGAMAVVGMWDDLRGLSARFRLVVHFAAAGVVLWALQLDFSLPVQVIFAVGLVWLTNLFNFMDGIDGYAAVQALVYCVGAHVVAGGIAGWTGDLIWVTAGASVAFLAFNWPPARIFMGDVGSGFIGLLLGFLVLHLQYTENVPFIASLILLAVFWFDATYTLCVRMVTKQEFTQAHRQHLYQHVAMRRGHLWTTLAFICYAALWLLPLTWLAVNFQDSWWMQAAALAAAVLPLAVLCYRNRAGLPGN